MPITIKLDEIEKPALDWYGIKTGSIVAYSYEEETFVALVTLDPNGERLITDIGETSMHYGITHKVLENYFILLEIYDTLNVSK